MARALYHGPALPVMDEATASVAGPITTIVVARRPTAVRDRDVIYPLEDGRIKDRDARRSPIERDTTFRAMAGRTV